MNRAPCVYERNGGERCATCNERYVGIAFGEDTGGECEWYATHTRGDVEPITIAEANQGIADREETLRHADDLAPITFSQAIDDALGELDAERGE